MRKILILILCFVTILSLTACDDNNGDNTVTPPNITVPVEKVYIDCSIKFSKDVEGNELYENNEFPVNTDIHVLVDFTFYNLDSNEDTIDFRVNLSPGVDTYSLYDYTKGPQEPTDVPHEDDKITEDGIIKVIEISGMKFVLKSENAKKKYSYVFTIKASQVNDDCSFKVLFSPQDGNFNNGKNKSFIAKYKFV